MGNGKEKCTHWCSGTAFSQSAYPVSAWAGYTEYNEMKEFNWNAIYHIYQDKYVLMYQFAVYVSPVFLVLHPSSFRAKGPPR